MVQYILIGTQAQVERPFQRAVLCNMGLAAETAVYVFESTCNSILSYACEFVHINDRNRQDLNKVQGKLVKCLIGLGRQYRITYLLQELNMHKITHIIDMNSIRLLHNIKKTLSAAQSFNNLLPVKISKSFNNQ